MSSFDLVQAALDALDEAEKVLEDAKTSGDPAAIEAAQNAYGPAKAAAVTAEETAVATVIICSA